MGFEPQGITIGGTGNVVYTRACLCRISVVSFPDPRTAGLSRTHTSVCRVKRTLARYTQDIGACLLGKKNNEMLRNGNCEQETTERGGSHHTPVKIGAIAAAESADRAQVSNLTPKSVGLPTQMRE